MNTTYPSQQDSQSQSPGQFNPSMPSAGGDDSEAIYVEEKKPINRSLVLLLVLAVFGAAMIYFMVVRGGSRPGISDPKAIKANETVANFIMGGGATLKTLEEQVKSTDKIVAVFKNEPGKGQVAVEQLKGNPFTFAPEADNIKDPPSGTTPKEPLIRFIDPLAATVAARAKLQIQSIIYSERGSTCVINSRLYQQNQRVVIDGIAFTVEQIGANFVIFKSPLSHFKLEILNKNDLSR